MTTVLQYLVIAAVVAAVLFGIALLVFGRGEQLSPLPARTSPVDLPDRNITGDDVRGVRFALAARGYRMSDVDWALERLANELDRTRSRLAELTRDVGDDDRYVPDPDQVDLFADEELPAPTPTPSPTPALVAAGPTSPPAGTEPAGDAPADDAPTDGAHVGDAAAAAPADVDER